MPVTVLQRGVGLPPPAAIRRAGSTSPAPAADPSQQDRHCPDPAMLGRQVQRGVAMLVGGIQRRSVAQQQLRYSIVPLQRGRVELRHLFAATRKPPCGVRR